MNDYSSVSIEELLRRCCDSGEITAWEEFVRRFHRLIAAIVIRTASRWGDSSVQTADDLIQETYLKLCADNYRILREFQHRDSGAFVGYVKVITANIVHDHFKSAYSLKRGSNQVESLPELLNPALGQNAEGSSQAMERFVLIQEIQKHLNECLSGTENDRNTMIFWLYYRTGLTASAIADLPGINLTTKGVESLILRLTGELRELLSKPEQHQPRIAHDSKKGIMPAESF